ncbi:MAG: ribonuclease PH [Candidatus Latescibacteria bacterium]|nr:ribonuclease PH [Candidatus Latescibacterota bacterium]
MRPDDRRTDEIRPLGFERGFTDLPAGSVLVKWGRNRLLCTVSVEPRLPPWLVGKGRGWATGEYAMLPASTTTRKVRDGARPKPDSRNVEISRLIGRSVRAALDLRAVGERTLWVDCDVLRADGGTRTAAISGAYVALHDALRGLEKDLELRRWPLTASVAAVSVGIVDGEPRLDLDYEEDSAAEVDMNVVMTGDGRIIEIQGTGEQRPFTMEEHEALVALAAKGAAEVTRIQTAALEEDAGD